MSKKSMAVRRQMREAASEGRTAGSRQQARGRSAGRNYRRADSRRPWGLISGVIGVVAVFLVVVVVLELTLTGNLKQDKAVLPAPASLITSLTTIPVHTLEAVKAGSISNTPLNIPASYKPAALTSDGLPEIGYVGAEFCPYCALQRWSLIVGLSRFGTWSGLHIIRSSVYDSPSNVPTFTFAYGAKFRSTYVAFVPREYQSNVSLNNDGAPYAALQSLPETLATAYSGIDSGGDYPFLDYAGTFVQIGSEARSTNVSALQGLTWDQVATQLRNTKSVAAQEILGGANYVTAATCVVTGEKPGSVCNSSMIKSLQTTLKATT
ncbi:MAG: DUF929 family protein [Candidatus Dormibacteria bacterium]